MLSAGPGRRSLPVGTALGGLRPVVHAFVPAADRLIGRKTPARGRATREGGRGEALGAQPSDGCPTWVRKALTVLFMSIDTVTGPTPPGTRRNKCGAFSGRVKFHIANEA